MLSGVTNKSGSVTFFCLLLLTTLAGGYCRKRRSVIEDKVHVVAESHKETAKLPDQPPVCPDGCSCTMPSITCRGHGHTVFPQFTGNFSGYTTVDMSSNSISNLPEGLCKNLVDLAKLELMQNKIQSIQHADVFHDCPRLTEISLSGNQLSIILSNTFIHTKNLEYLDLSKNKIDTLSPVTIGILKNLKTLNLSRNRLRVFDCNEIVDAEALRDLDISDNLLEQLNCTNMIPNIETLLLGNNQISDTRKVVLKNMPLLKILDIHGNKLSGNVPMEYKLPSLQRLLLSENQIVNFTMASLVEMGVLRMLNITDNPFDCRGLAAIPKNITSVFATCQNYSDYRPHKAGDNAFPLAGLISICIGILAVVTAIFALAVYMWIRKDEKTIRAMRMKSFENPAYVKSEQIKTESGETKTTSGSTRKNSNSAMISDAIVTSDINITDSVHTDKRSGSINIKEHALSTSMDNAQLIENMDDCLVTDSFVNQ